MNLLLVDYTVPDYEVFVSSVNSNTMPIVYFPDTTRQELLASLSGTIERIAVVSHTNTFIEKESLFSVSNIELFKTIIEKHQVKHIDYLACNTLQNTEWINYFGKLPCVIGASNDLTGNLKYGGDWIMESTAEDIEAVYFTKSIEYYKYLLLPSYTDINGLIYTYNTTTFNANVIGFTNIKTDVVIPSSIIIDNVTYSVKLIGANAFNGTGLKHVTIPKSVVSISNNSFTECTSLLSVAIPYTIDYSDDLFPTNTAICELDEDEKTVLSVRPNNFESYNLTGLDIDTIGEYAFQNFNMKTVTFPSNLTKIEHSAFENCTKLERVLLDTTRLTRIGDSAFQNGGTLGEVTFPTTLTTIDNYAFQNSSLTTVTVPSSTTFGKFVFACSNSGNVNVETMNN